MYSKFKDARLVATTDGNREEDSVVVFIWTNKDKLIVSNVAEDKTFNQAAREIQKYILDYERPTTIIAKVVKSNDKAEDKRIEEINGFKQLWNYAQSHASDLPEVEKKCSRAKKLSLHPWKTQG